ncbi:MAG: CHASE2 domain-containing protein [Bryobacterales bacterium]|nr:CHASE2 and HATPase_c domain-containing protein [Bryobacteraceae bacterium]MDW8353516.1 CHASE2 domain-containing protein [Bryobacterales bacterium]
MALSRKQAAGYGLTLAAAWLGAVLSGFTAFARQVDLDAYDWIFRLLPPQPWRPEAALLTVDEPTLVSMGGLRRLREILAEGLERLIPAGPSVVAVDVTLADPGDPEADARLAAALSRTPQLVLASEMLPDGRDWQDPLPEFARWAAAVGHVHAAPDELDGVNRKIPLEKAAGRQRRWALAFEAFRMSRGGGPVVETPEEVQAGGRTIPARREDSRALAIRYLRPDPSGVTPLPRASVLELRRDPALAGLFRGKVVFVGVTAQSAARDRLVTPYSSSRPMPGVEIHANAFETLVQGRFLRPVSETATLGLCVAVAILAGLVFAFLAGWPAYAAAALLLLAVHTAPLIAFRQDLVLPFSLPVATAWLCAGAAASYQHFVVRRQLRRAEAEKRRYQQAVQFVTHEMRTPLTAIQGSSELMSRYSLSEEKRKQIAELIHNESRRLARMVETFLNVERLAAGQMELRREAFAARRLVEACLERVRPLAERKRIRIRIAELGEERLVGDQELMEYAVYNLLTNAVKYSPTDTEVTVSLTREGDSFRLSVRDQGIGMDEDEIKNIFHKFYRTRQAIASGESGAGIGLSLVEQIVVHHGGRVEVSSAPGKGSCFTLILPANASAIPQPQ